MLQNKFSHIKGFFFDLDGTLIDTAPDFAITVNRLRNQYGFPPLEDQDIRMHVSTGAAGLIKACFQTKDEKEFDIAKEALLDIYFNLNHPHSVLFPDAEQFIDTLDEYQLPWGIITNKPAKFAVPLIQKLGLDQRMVCLLCPDHVRNKKPDPESLLLAASTAKLQASECIYFGDHSRDIEAAKAAKMLTASVGFGYISPQENALEWQADYHFDSFKHIYDTFFASSQ